MRLPIHPLLLPCLAALLGAAQSGPPNGPRAQPGVEKPVLERRPNLESVTPIPGHPRPEGDVLLDAPHPVGAPVLVDSQPLAQDAVIASETMELAPLNFRLDAPVALGPPFNIVFPAGTEFRRLVRDNVTRHCVRRIGHFVPAFDENHQIYPGLCLEDRDRDGRFETAILEPYDPEHAPVRTVAIAPVSLEPDPAAEAGDPQALRARRRLRVTHVGASDVQIIAEQGISDARQQEMSSYYGRPEESLTLPLRGGASGSLGGVQLRLLRDGTGWRIAAAGRLAPWLEVRDNGNRVLIGGMEFRLHS